jgi:protein involved in polysaccharide export with SLBB domain
VPERRNDVAVLGAVVRPGLLAHVPGRTVADYLAVAGGYSRRAYRNEATVLRAGTGTRLSAQEVRTLEPGDRLVVPFREYRTILERVQTTQVAISILSGAALTVATLIALFN